MVLAQPVQLVLALLADWAGEAACRCSLAAPVHALCQQAAEQCGSLWLCQLVGFVWQLAVAPWQRLRGGASFTRLGLVLERWDCGCCSEREGTYRWTAQPAVLHSRLCTYPSHNASLQRGCSAGSPAKLRLARRRMPAEAQPQAETVQC